METPIYFYNSLTKSKDEFAPITPGKAGLYNCGPTVYDYAHIGNFRTYILGDLIRRVLEYNGYEVTEAMNITDVGHLNDDGDNGDDKITLALLRQNKELNLENMRELANFYADAFVEDLEKLNILAPHHLPYASDHITENIEIIKKLEAKGFAYVTGDGVYFDTSKMPDYGKLGGINLDEDETQARVAENTEKKSFRDFALWKFNEKLGWESPWGQGFPGWHIECSGMSTKYLGDHFDLHTGGIDLLPTHHNNEIAQSCCATGKDFVNYWIHGEFLKVDGQKMSKSKNNFYTLRDILERGFEAVVFRYWTLMGHYRTQINFTWEALEGTKTALDRLYHLFQALGDETGTINGQYQQEFHGHINNDLDMPRALATVWGLIKDETVSDADKRTTLLDFDRVLGLGFTSQQPIEVPAEVQTLVDERETARTNKDFARSDELRDRIAALGFHVEDSENGPRIVVK